MKKAAKIIVFIALFTLCIQSKVYAGEKKFMDKADVLINNYGTTSLQYVVMEGDKVILSETDGMYSKTQGNRPTKDNMYGIGSVSKMYTTAAVMQLVDEGKIDLDLPLINYIPDFKMADPRFVNITPRMLLNHSSGLMGTTDKGSMLFNDNDTKAHDELLKNLQVQRLKADPGEFSVYCNDGFSLAEILVERVSGMSFTEYLKKNICDVLDLTKTKTPIDKFNYNDLSKTYSVNPNKEDKVENVNSIGAGGIYSTAEEMCKFAQAITKKDTGRLLSNKSIDAMEEKEYLKGIWVKDEEDNAVGYGLGWDSVNLFPFNRYNIKALCKGGDTFCYHSCIISLPEYNISMAVVSSGGSSTLNENFASQVLLEILKERGIINDILEDASFKEEISQVMPSYLKDYSGLYNLGDRLVNIKISDDGVLTISELNSEASDCYYHTYGDYFIKKNKIEGLCFVHEKNNITYLEMKQYINRKNLGQDAHTYFIGQKTEPQKLNDNEKKVWKERENKTYFLVSEKYSSVIYGFGKSFTIDKLPYENEGYFGGYKIIDDNTAKGVVKLPVMLGRDLNDLKFDNIGEKKYVTRGTLTAILEDSVDEMNCNLKEVTIDEDGFTKWFKVPKEMEGKTLEVDSSNKTSFNVYDENYKCINDSYIDGCKKVTLKEGEYIAFAGDINEHFKLNIK